MRNFKMRLVCCSVFLIILVAICTSALADEPVRIKQAGSNKKWGYVDETGNFVIKAQYLSAQDFVNGLAVVQISKNGYAMDQYIDYNG